jgi:hypothetical protein
MRVFFPAANWMLVFDLGRSKGGMSPDALRF